MAKKKEQKTLEESADNGRKPTLPSLLLTNHHKKNQGINNGNGKSKPSFDEVPMAEMSGSMPLEDYNAFERLLEAGTPEDLDTRTELNELQILHFARAEIMAEYYKSNVLRDFVASIKRKQISKNRKGRTEFTQAIRGQMPTDMMGPGNISNSISDKLRG